MKNRDDMMMDSKQAPTQIEIKVLLEQLGIPLEKWQQFLTAERKYT
ncbi:hypothetical protein [Paenibacillus sp. R14(2021)]|nr:hypothetical protein [Paenibacillus sp. R14(2021)]